MKVPFFDLKRLYRLTEHDVDRAIRHTLESGHYILGQQVKDFEAHMKTALVGASAGHVIGCNSGTDALILPMLALDIGQGDEVIVPSHTAIPTITAIRSVGATPVFVDINPNTWLMDLHEVASLLTKQTKAVIAVHLYGSMIDISALRKTLQAAGRSDVVIIEDVAQAHGSEFNGKQAGTLGDFGAFSFYPTKNIGALGDAGAIFTANAEHAEKINWLRNYGQRDRYNALAPRGLNSRLDEIQAAILLARYKYLDKWNDRKADMMAKYREALEGLPFEFQKISDNCEPNWHLCVIKLDKGIHRDKVQKQLEDLGVTTLVHYPIPTHTQKAFAEFKTRSLPVTEELAQQILSLPLNPTLMIEEIDHVIACLRKGEYK